MTNADIQVGEYVRTKDGDIFKLAEFYDRTPLYSMQDENGILYGNPNKVVKKHSFNLIDLIEVGDYVNGVKIGREELFDNGLRIIGEDIGDCYYETTFRSDKPEEVKIIVTKEQFKAMEYKVGGEDDQQR